MKYSLPKPCLSCGFLVGGGRTRCIRCQAAYEAGRGPQRQAYRDPMYKAIKVGTHCEQCGGTTDLTKDHVQPLVFGGSNAPENIRTLCRTCNSSKGAKV